VTASHPAPEPIWLSICIPTYNFGAFIGQTLESVLPQVSDGVEVVVLDGGSTDETPDVVAGFQDRYPGRLRYERRPERGGIDRDLARTVAMAAGEYCWLFCSDDVMKPGSVDLVRAQIETGLDVYVCGFTLAAPDMRPLFDQRIMAPGAGAVFDLGSREGRGQYFSSARTTPAFFSFAGSLIVRKQTWNRRDIDEDFVGSCWAHAARLFSLMDDGLRLGWIETPLLLKRTENDSFMDAGIVRRYALAIDGYHRLAETFFGGDSDEARHVRRVVANEFPPWILLAAKAEARRERPEDVALLDRLAATTYEDRSAANRIKHATYRLAPLGLFTRARALYGRLMTALRRR
jgi:abequosyltransferase